MARGGWAGRVATPPQLWVVPLDCGGTIALRAPLGGQDAYPRLHPRLPRALALIGAAISTHRGSFLYARSSGGRFVQPPSLVRQATCRAGMMTTRPCAACASASCSTRSQVGPGRAGVPRRCLPPPASRLERSAAAITASSRAPRRPLRPRAVPGLRAGPLAAAGKPLCNPRRRQMPGVPQHVRLQRRRAGWVVPAARRARRSQLPEGPSCPNPWAWRQVGPSGPSAFEARRGREFHDTQ